MVLCATGRTLSFTSAFRPPPQLPVAMLFFRMAEAMLPRASGSGYLLLPSDALPAKRCVARDSNTGHQLLSPPANCCPMFASWTMFASRTAQGPLALPALPRPDTHRRPARQP